jgi:hypothetical protein
MHKILIYLHTIYLLKSSTCFEHYPAHLQEGYVVIVHMQPLVSSLSAGDCPVHRLRKNFSSFLTLVDLQLDAQNSYLFTYNTFIQILYMFRALPSSSSGGLRRNCIYTALVSSLSAGDCPVHRLRKNWSSFLTGAQDSHLQRVTIPEAVYIQIRRRPPEDEQGNARNM